MQYVINHTPIVYEAQAEREWGDKTVLLNHAIDLTGHPWREKGYTIQPLFDADTNTAFYRSIHALLVKKWQQAGLQVPPEFALDQYHTLINDYTQHLEAVNQTKLLTVQEFPIPIKTLETRISEICGQELIVKNPFDQQSVFHFRVIRPNSKDNNPLHRDVWLEDYDNCINLYIPVAGSNALSSLILIPGSHYWPESKIEKTVGGAWINGVKFNVPAVTAIEGSYEILRANPAVGEVLVFSPYLIHGGAINLNPGVTRISVEIRLWKK
jgi:hypothetical protein